MKNLLSIEQLTGDEIKDLLALGHKLKAERGHHERLPLKGQTWALIFSKSSTRTRVSFEVGISELGGRPMFLSVHDIQLGRGEPIKDTARVLGRMIHGAAIRTYGQQEVEEFAGFSGIPTINALTDEEHPCQILADLLTIQEKFGRLEGIRFTYMGDARNNMGNSLMIGCAKMGLHFTACAPSSLFPAPELVEKAKEFAAASGGSVTLTEDVDQGPANADVIYTDIWVSMGEADSVWAERIKLLKPYQVNAGVMAKAAPNAIFMHCLPSFHDTNTTIGAQVAKDFGVTEMEVANEVFEGPQSVVFDEAENRMHTIKAVMYATLQ